jgi:hypothetical protein
VEPFFFLLLVSEVARGGLEAEEVDPLAMVTTNSRSIGFGFRVRGIKRRKGYSGRLGVQWYCKDVIRLYADGFNLVVTVFVMGS